MSWSNSGSSMDKKELKEIIANEQHCPDEVKEIIADAIDYFDEGKIVSFSTYGHMNEDGTGNFSISVTSSNSEPQSTTTG
jgi:hypothetical protein